MRITSEDAVLRCNQMCAVVKEENDVDCITAEVLNEVIEKYSHKRNYPYYKNVFAFIKYLFLFKMLSLFHSYFPFHVFKPSLFTIKILYHFYLSINNYEGHEKLG